MHAIAAAQKLPLLSLKSQFIFIAFAILQLLAAAATMLGKAVGSSSPGLTSAVRILLIAAPVAADTDLNPKLYHILFILSVLWTGVCVAAILFIAQQGTSIARCVSDLRAG